MTARDRVSFKFFIFSAGWRRLKIHAADNRSASQARDRGLEMNWLDEEPAKEVRNEWRRKTGTSHSQLFLIPEPGLRIISDLLELFVYFSAGIPNRHQRRSSASSFSPCRSDTI